MEMRVVTWNVRSLHRMGTLKTVDTMSCIVLRGPWCCIIFLNMHAPRADKGDDVKGSFCATNVPFGEFPRYDVQILLGDFNAKVAKEDIFKLTIGYVS
jgi:hypothetical protein